MPSTNIFPQSEHLKVVRLTSLILADWPFMSDKHPVLKRVYETYSLCALSCYTLFVISSSIQFVFLIEDEIVLPEEILHNLAITFCCSVTVIRALAVRTDKLKSFITEIINREKRILKSKDETLIRIYRSYARRCRIINAVFVIGTQLTSLTYCISPIFLDPSVRFYTSRNETVIKKALPLALWLPFDEQEYYAITWALLSLVCCIAACFVTYTDAFIHSIIVFVVGQIKILQHILSNFDGYAVKVEQQLNCDLEEARFITMRECIVEHQHILSYVSQYNSSLNIVMLLDFLQSSLQLASVILQLVMVELTIFNTFLSMEFMFAMVARLTIYYWYANEILVQSAEIPLALNYCNWYEQSFKIQKMMLIMMMRCSREISLQIGPFTTMTLTTFLGILKATYSYITIFCK